MMASDRPACPRCGESDRVALPGEPFGASAGSSGGAWCNRCHGYTTALTPLPGRHRPDFEGPALARGRRKA